MRVIITALGIIALVALALARPTFVTAQQKLPPVSYVCPMAGDEDVIEDKAGKCRKCGMTLTPIRLDTTWTCPVHAAVHMDKPGKCPIDGRELIQMIVSITWRCPGSPTESLQPGKCPDGSAMTKNFTPRPHGNHNPQHGGQFFMAPDNWHHLEGTYPRAGVFRMYLYDDYTKPLPRDQQQQVTAQVVVQGQSYPLALAPNGRYLEGKIGAATIPASMQAKVKFKTDSPQNVFDFTFDKYSKEPPPGTPLLTKAAPSAAPVARANPEPGIRNAEARTENPEPRTPNPEPRAANPEPAVSPNVGPSGVEPALITLPIPDTVPEIIAQLRTRTNQIRTLIDRGMFADVYVPAFHAKDLALALAERGNALPADRRRAADPAISKLVRTAYLLDAFGDLGNKQQITAAFAEFAAASKDIVSVFPQ